MSAGTLDLVIEQGTTFIQPLIWKDPSNVVIDITGYTARMQARSIVSDAGVLVDLTTENGGLVIDGTNGKVTITISAVATAAYTFTTAVYDLELISAGGIVTRLVKGKLTIDPEVTRS